MREWLIAIGVLVVFGILLDGLRRMRNANRDSIQMTMSMEKGLNRDEFDELPGGGARVIKSAEERERDYLEKKAVEPRKPLMPTRKPTHVRDEASARNEPSLGNSDTPLDEELNDTCRKEPALGTELDADPDLMRGAAAVLSKPRVVPREKTAVSPSGKSTPLNSPVAAQAPDKVIVMHVLAPSREKSFDGAALLETLLNSGMRYGERNIFHHYIDDGEAGVYYSLANAVKPGSFDLDEMESFRTPGVSLFMVLPNDGDALKAFDTMLMTIHNLLKNLGGELRDENRNVMTQQTIAHARQEVVDFERSQLSKAAASD